MDVEITEQKIDGAGGRLELTARAEVGQIEFIVNRVNDMLEKYHVPNKSILQIDVALDEILSNIAFYAYKGREKGNMMLSCEYLSDERIVKLIFSDDGVQYNPLSAKDPDTTLSADERGVGGLGIFIVKKTMDIVSYEFLNGQNVLTVVKSV